MSHPRITIVTPSYNQAQYVGWTVRSVLLQRYPELEYIVMDGGSNDGTMDVLAPYADMDSPYAAVSWGWRMLTGCVDDEAFRQFYDDHVDQAPESLPQDPGSACP